MTPKKMTAEQLAMRISAKYPNQFAKKETRAVWERDYRHALAHLDGDQIETAYNRVMSKWKNPWPPHPYEFVNAAPKKKAGFTAPLYNLTEMNEYAQQNWTAIADKLRVLHRREIRKIEKDDQLGYGFRRATACAAKRAAQHAFLISRGCNARPIDICKADDREYLASKYGECDVSGGDFFTHYLRLAGLEVPASESASSPPAPEDIPDKSQE